jgi:hypothetical protein
MLSMYMYFTNAHTHTHTNTYIYIYIQAYKLIATAKVQFVFCSSMVARGMDIPGTHTHTHILIYLPSYECAYVMYISGDAYLEMRIYMYM